jgi:signal transduction histidine kinase
MSLHKNLRAGTASSARVKPRFPAHASPTLELSPLEQERRRISHELHDQPLQTLAWAQLRLAELYRHEGSAPLRPMLEDVRQLIRGVSQQLRGVIDGLAHNPAVGERLDDALRLLVREMHQRFVGSPSILLNLHGPRLALSPAQMAAVLRAVQELLANLRKHSEVSQALLSSSCSQRCVEVLLADGGRGFDPAEADPTRGLASIRQRLETIGARLTIDSRPGLGTCARIVIPLACAQRRPLRVPAS